MTIIALFCVDKFGRRKFLLTGAILMGISILTLGIVCHFEQSGVPSKSCIDQTDCKNTSPVNLTNKTLTDFKLNFTEEQSSSTITTKISNTLSVTLPQNLSGFSMTAAKMQTNHITSVKLNISESQTHTKSVIKRESFTNAHTGSSATPKTNVSDSGKKEDGARALVLKIAGFSALMTFVAAYGFSFGPGD